MNASRVTVRVRDLERIILVEDQMVFLYKDGYVEHCDSTNELLSDLCNNESPPVTDSERIDQW